MPKNKCSHRGKKCQWPELEDKLIVWIEEQRQSGYIVTRNMIRIKALVMTDELNITGFQASNNWCTRFLAHHNLALHLYGCHSCHTRRENSHNQYYWPWEVLLHSRPFLPGWWKKLKPMVIFKWKTQPKEKFPPGVVVHHHPKGWMDADGMKLWIQKVWSLWRSAKKKKLACLGLVSRPPCRPSETSAPPNQHRCGRDTWRIDQCTTATRCESK